MAKKADGFELKFTHRGSWMVKRLSGFSIAWFALSSVRRSGHY